MNKTLLVTDDIPSARKVESAGYCKFSGNGKKEYLSRATKDFRIIYVERGRLSFIRCGEVIHTSEAGSLVIVPSGSRDHTSCTSDCHDFLISFSGFEDTLSTLGISTVEIEAKKCTKNADRIKALFEGVIEELQLKEAGYSVSAEEKLLKLLIYFCRAESTESIAPSASKTKLSPAILVMNNEFDKTYSMDYYAKLCNMSKSSFLHLFSKTMGTAPIKYLNGIKIKNASVMLIETDMPIAEIAAAVGFSSSQYFSNTFLAYYKMRPKDYRIAYSNGGTKYDYT